MLLASSHLSSVTHRGVGYECLKLGTVEAGFDGFNVRVSRRGTRPRPRSLLVL